MQERDVEQKLVTEARKRGGWALKFVSPGTTGVPDRVILMPGGRTGFVELKAPGKKLRPLQRMRKEQFEKLGCRVYVIDEPGMIPGVLDEIGGEAR